MYMYFDQTRLAATLRSVSEVELFQLQTKLGPLGFEKSPLGVTPMVRLICVSFGWIVTFADLRVDLSNGVTCSDVHIYTCDQEVCIYRGTYSNKDTDIGKVLNSLFAEFFAP